jgi:hypothetical protein
MGKHDEKNVKQAPRPMNIKLELILSSVSFCVSFLHLFFASKPKSVLAEQQYTWTVSVNTRGGFRKSPLREGSADDRGRRHVCHPCGPVQRGDGGVQAQVRQKRADASGVRVADGSHQVNACIDGRLLGTDVSNGTRAGLIPRGEERNSASFD